MSHGEEMFAQQGDAPNFGLVRRGYDKPQVDEYLAQTIARRCVLQFLTGRSYAQAMYIGVGKRINDVSCCNTRVLQFKWQIRTNDFHKSI